MLRRVHHSEKIDLTCYADDGDEDDQWQPFKSLLLHGIWSLVTHQLRKIFEEFESKGENKDMMNSPSFPHLWAAVGEKNEDGIGGELPDDPLTIYIDLPLGYHSDALPVWSLTVTECVDDLISSAESTKVGKILSPWPSGVIAIRDALRAQAQRIDDALSEETAMAALDEQVAQ